MLAAVSAGSLACPHCDTAVGNGDLGIEAVRGVIDRGGNRAHGSAGAMQCRNVACG